MSKVQELYDKIASEIPDIKKGKMFGAQCIKAPNGKAGVMLWHDYMIFKLEADELKKALSLDGAKMFTPMEGRPMNGWVQLSYDYSAIWPDLAKKAMDYVRLIEK
jgi:hypothetical protein